MTARTVVILGGGWGGLAVAHALRELLSPEHRVIAVERRSVFSLCVSYLWLMTGEHEGRAVVQRELARLARPGIDWVRANVERIDPAARRVETEAGPLEADYLVIAMGAELTPEMVPGLDEHGFNLYDAEGALAIRDALASLSAGRVLVAVARTPFRCPAAPYEAAMLVESMLRQRGVRERVDIALYTPEKQPMPVAGARVGEALRSMLSDRAIDYRTQRTLSRVDAGRATFGDEAVPFDLLLVVPPHRAPPAVAAAGLTDGTGYVPVHPGTLEILSDPETLQTQYPGVFAIGDVTSIRLMNSLLLPKAGVFVEAQARVVAANIAARIRGQEPRARFDGRGFCYVETGEGLAAYGEGDFYAFPEPRVSLAPPSAAHKRAKHEYERVLEAWFLPQLEPSARAPDGTRAQSP